MATGADKFEVVWNVRIDLRPFYRLAFLLMATQAALPFPCHDPPVGWLDVIGFDQVFVNCPALGAELRRDQVPAEVPVLGSEPGWHPCSA